MPVTNFYKASLPKEEEKQEEPGQISSFFKEPKEEEKFPEKGIKKMK